MRPGVERGDQPPSGDSLWKGDGKQAAVPQLCDRPLPLEVGLMQEQGGQLRALI